MGPVILAGREAAGCEGFAGEDTGKPGREGDIAEKRLGAQFSKETRVQDKEDL